MAGVKGLRHTIFAQNRDRERLLGSGGTALYIYPPCLPPTYCSGEKPDDHPSTPEEAIPGDTRRTIQREKHADHKHDQLLRGGGVLTNRSGKGILRWLEINSALVSVPFTGKQFVRRLMTLAAFTTRVKCTNNLCSI